MEKEYQKIGNVFKFDAVHKTVVGLNEPFETLKNLVWVGTEKIDGTNIRVFWDGHSVEIAGHTDKAEIPPFLKKSLDEIFLTQEMEYLFEQTFQDKQVYLFGEGYGSGIQRGGGAYRDDEKGTGFILFDVKVNGYDLDRANVREVAEALGIDTVPVVFEGTLDEAKRYVASHQMSTLGHHTHEMEGLVLVPKNISLYDRNGNVIKCKCKYRDMLKAGLVEVNG